MKLNLAIAVARQQLSPNFLGKKQPEYGLYRTNNGTWMTGRIADHPTALSWQAFLARFGKQ